MGTHERRRGGDAADRALPAAADRLLLRTVWRGGHWAALLAVTSIAGAVADTVLPAAAGHTVDIILQAAERPGTAASVAGRTGHWLAGCIALIILIVICEAAGQFAIGMSTAGATAWLRLRLSSHVFACGLRLPRRFPAGDLVGRVTGGAADASYAAAGGVPAVAAVIPPAGSIVALALINPWLAVAFAAGLPGLAMALRVFVRDASDVAVRYQRAQGAITARLLDALAGARTIAAAGTCDQEAARVLVPLAEPVPAQGTRRLPQGPGCLTLSAVTVRSDGEPVLDGVDATFPGGAVVAVVGRSGAGKSLLAAVAGRLLDPDEGDVRLDRVSLASLDRAQLRRAVVYAFDRPALFGRTPGEAIAFGASRPVPARVLSAARDASAYEFLRRLPAGLDTPLDDAPMSGGEVQRIGLARAFAHADEARLLILDDAMSSLDTITEMQVATALTSRLDHRTCLIIAHRAATAARADLVAWLDGGKLHPPRPHHELWRDPRYRAVFADG